MTPIKSMVNGKSVVNVLTGYLKNKSLTFLTKWNRGTMCYDAIHHLKVNNLLVGVN